MLVLVWVLSLSLFLTVNLHDVVDDVEVIVNGISTGKDVLDADASRVEVGVPTVGWSSGVRVRVLLLLVERVVLTM